jgi:RNA polymerase sigma factor (sigma-70 family)
VTIFSTLLSFDQQRSPAWTVDGQLRRNFLRLCGNEELPRTKKWYWTRQLHSQWREQSTSQDLARRHLIALLQESCYWAAVKAVQALRRDPTGASVEVPEVFQDAIADVDIVLHKYDASLGSELETFAYRVFKSRLRDRLYRGQQYRTLSTWSLLRHVSRSLLTRALERAGVVEPKLSTWLLAWTIYRQLYVPENPEGPRELPGPDPFTWQTIVDQFERTKHVHLTTPPASVTADMLQAWLTECAVAVRRHQIRTVSIEALADQLDRTGDELLRAEGPLPFDTILAAETTELARQVNAVLDAALAKLSPERQHLLALRFRDKLEQKQIASLLSTTQATVSRRLAQCRAVLAEALARWSAQELHQPLDANLYKAVESAIDQWLHEHYPRTASGG